MLVYPSFCTGLAIIQWFFFCHHKKGGMQWMYYYSSTRLPRPSLILTFNVCFFIDVFLQILIFTILTIHKHSLGSCEVPQKVWARWFSRFDVYRLQTNRQAKYIYIYRCIFVENEKGWIISFLQLGINMFALRENSLERFFSVELNGSNEIH